VAGPLDGEPIPDGAADGAVLDTSLPGVDIVRIHDDLSATAPCLYFGDNAWLWSGAVVQAAGAAR
jgi:hypothetical protein